MDFSDPDLVARVYVMQWMHENGLHNALRALEKEVGRLYDDSQLPEASQLMQLVWRHVEERAAEQQELDEEAEKEKEEAEKEAGKSQPGGSRSGGGGGGGFRSRRQQQHEESLQLLRAGCGDYAGRAVVADVPPEVHRANIIAVRMVPEQNCVITGAGDGCVRCVRYGSLNGGGGSGAAAAAAGGGGVVWQTRVSGSAVLSLALHPDFSRGLPLVAVGCMDGRVAVLHGPSGAPLASGQPHTKYVVRVAWAHPAAQPPPPDPAPRPIVKPGEADAVAASPGSATEQQQQPVPVLVPSTLFLATASTDETVAILRLDVAGRGSGAGRSGAEAEAAEPGRLTTVRQIPYGAAVTDIAFLPSKPGPGGGASAETEKATTAMMTAETIPPAAAAPAASAAVAAASLGGSAAALPLSLSLVVAVRGSNYLCILDVGRLAAASEPTAGGGGGGGPVSESLVNLNEAGDDHVSFTAKHLAASPCGRYLLVCTDTPRLLVLRTRDWTHLRALFGLPVDQFPQPVAAWHRDSNYVYAAGANGQLCVFHLGSGRLLHSAAPHKINVRDLDYDPTRNLLATCSFDKTVKLLAA